MKILSYRNIFKIENKDSMEYVKLMITNGNGELLTLLNEYIISN